LKVSLNNIVETDVLVVGAGGAGARAAIEAREAGAEVLMIDKGIFGRSGVTLMAPYTCMAAFGHADPRDGPDMHFQDTVKGGSFLSNQKIVEVFAKEAPQRILDLVRFGAKFDMIGDKFDQVLMPGHTYPRGVHLDMRTGLQIMAALVREVKRCRVEVLEDTTITSLLTSQGSVVGATGLDIENGEFIVFSSKSTIVCTGGGMEIFEYSSASTDVVGDGYAMAYRAGAELVDMEFVQFYPTGIVWPPQYKGRLGVGNLRYNLKGRLYNIRGERFMERYDPERMELSTRDIVSRAIYLEVMEGRGSLHGGAYLDVSYLPPNLLEHWVAKNPVAGVGQIINLLGPDIDIRKEAVEVFPVAHYFCGGIRIDENCKSNLPGLFAAGEAAGGLDGANRIEGNALAKTQVQGARAGRIAAQRAKSNARLPIDESQVEKEYERVFGIVERRGGIRPVELKRKVKTLAWKSAGVVRDKPWLEEGLTEVSRMRREAVPRLCTSSGTRSFNREWLESLEVCNMIEVLEMVLRASYARTESRGCHYRRDYQQRDDQNWLKNIVVKKENGEKVTTVPVVMTKLTDW